MKIAATLFSIILCLLVCGCSFNVKIVNDENTQNVSYSSQNEGESVQVSVAESEIQTENSEPVSAEEQKDDDLSSVEQTDTSEVKTNIESENRSEEKDEKITESEVTVPEVAAPVVVPAHVAVNGISLSTYNVTISVGYTTMPYVTMSPSNATNKGEKWVSSDISVATVDYLGNIRGVSVGNCTVTVTSTDNPDVFASVNVNVIPETQCTYIDGILIANKTYPLPQSYAPGWDPVASQALQVMFADAKKDGISLRVCSGYRSYIDQKIIYNGYVARDGQAAADRYSARPGHSEHQTGLAFDINNTNSNFGETPEGKWLAENCYKYGFIIRYPKDKEHITGYIYEPWHVRYLGIEKAKEVYDSGLCLEEFLGITSVYQY